ncbi:hypothetical protein ACTXT7_017062, partial [Hymenolepis weldensis]
SPAGVRKTIATGTTVYSGDLHRKFHGKNLSSELRESWMSISVDVDGENWMKDFCR